MREIKIMLKLAELSPKIIKKERKNNTNKLREKMC